MTCWRLVYWFVKSLIGFITLWYVLVHIYYEFIQIYIRFNLLSTSYFICLSWSRHGDQCICFSEWEDIFSQQCYRYKPIDIYVFIIIGPPRFDHVLFPDFSQLICHFFIITKLVWIRIKTTVPSQLINSSFHIFVYTKKLHCM